MKVSISLDKNLRAGPLGIFEKRRWHGQWNRNRVNGAALNLLGRGCFFRVQEPRKPVSRRSVAVRGVLLTKRRQKNGFDVTPVTGIVG